MNLELISQMVGGLEGLQTALTPFYPKLEQAIKEGLTAKRAEFSEMMEKENFSSIGYTFLDDGKNERPILVLLAFRLQKKGDSVCKILHFGTVTEFLNSLLSLAKTVTNEAPKKK